MSRRNVSYTDAEDKLLCTVYSDLSQNPIVGRGQSRETFWNQIVDAFNDQNAKDSAPAIPHHRTLKSLEGRFSLIQTQCKLFLGCIKTAEDLKVSGASEMDIIIMAKDMFKKNAATNKKGFQFDHVFSIMQNMEKFKDHNEPRHPHKISRKNFSTHVSSSSENATPDSPNISSFNINLSEDNVDVTSFDVNASVGGSSYERPIGVKKAKAKRKNDEVQAADFAKLQQNTQQMMGMMKDTIEHRHQYFLQEQEKMAFYKAKREDKIMSIDLNAITDPDTHAYYKQEKEKIIRSRMGPPPGDSSSGGLFSQYFNNFGGGGSDLGDY